MGDRPGSLKLGSFKLLDVGGREPGCPGRGCIYISLSIFLFFAQFVLPFLPLIFLEVDA